MMNRKSILVCEKCSVVGEDYGCEVDRSTKGLNYDSTMAAGTWKRKKNTYHRPTHFKDMLSSLQGTFKSNIPADVMKTVTESIVSRNLHGKKRTFSEDIEIVRGTLKSLNLSKYYEKCAQMAYVILGTAVPQLTQPQEQTLIMMFEQLNAVYPKYRPKGRKNMISYKYVMLKLLEICELNDIIPAIKRIKSNDRLKIHEAIWEEVCRDLNWKFYPYNPEQ